MLNQKQCQNVIKSLYDYKDQAKEDYQTSQQSYASNISKVSYEEYYRRIKEMGKSEKLSEDEVRKFLGDRALGEKAYRKVSKLLIFILINYQWMARKTGSLHHKTEEALLRLHEDNQRRILERERIVKEKELFEKREADYLANRRTDINY